MDFIKRLDPELAAAFANFPAEDCSTIEQLQELRFREAQGTAMLRANRPLIDGVMFEDRVIASLDGAAKITIRLYRPSSHNEALPALLWLHGGGLLLGNIESDYRLCSQIARDVNCVVLATDYRLAPEHVFPAALDDAHAALQWLAAHADAIGVRHSRIAVGGASAGAGLAASLALLSRDRGEIALAFQLLLYPMLDDRSITPSSHAVTDARVWNRAKNLFGWRSYLRSSLDDAGLGILRGGIEILSTSSPTDSAYAAAARAQNLSGLPPTYVAVGALDLFFDEDVDYAARLLQAGVATELHVYPGAFHSFDGAVPSAAISRRFTDDYFRALRRALHP